MFAYADAVTERFPTIRAGVVHASGLANGPSPAAALLDDYRAEQRAARARLKATAIADLPSIAAWRRAFSRFGVKPTQHRNAAEALLRRLAKHGDIPSVNTLVDIGNLVSIRHAMPVAAFDLAGIDGSITVRFATGDERFTDLGSSDGVFPDPGEVIFVDDDDVVSARRWCWRQSAQSATGQATAFAQALDNMLLISAATVAAAAALALLLVRARDFVAEPPATPAAPVAARER